MTRRCTAQQMMADLEIRVDDLRFILGEARELFQAAGVELAKSALVMLSERTEGWAAELRLAVLSLAGHPYPGRFAAEFSAVSGRWPNTCWLRCWSGVSSPRATCSRSSACTAARKLRRTPEPSACSYHFPRALRFARPDQSIR